MLTNIHSYANDITWGDTLKNLKAKVSAFRARGGDKRRSSIRGSLEKDASWICIRINFILVFVSRGGFHRLEIWALSILASLSLSLFSSYSSSLLFFKVSHEAARWKYRGLNGGENDVCPKLFSIILFSIIFQREILLISQLRNSAIKIFSVFRRGTQLCGLPPIKDLSLS